MNSFCIEKSRSIDCHHKTEDTNPTWRTSTSAYFLSMNETFPSTIIVDSRVAPSGMVFRRIGRGKSSKVECLKKKSDHERNIFCNLPCNFILFLERFPEVLQTTAIRNVYQIILWELSNDKIKETCNRLC